MRRHLALSIAGIFLLAACEAPELVGQPVIKRPSSLATRNEGARATPEPSSTPSPSPEPTAPVTRLSGIVKVDAAYVVAAGAGTVISKDGASVIAAGAGNVVAFGGGNVIANGGGNVIAPGAGNVISKDGAGVISKDGSSFRLFDTGGSALGAMLPARGLLVVPVSLATGKPLGPPVLSDDSGAYQVTIPEGTTENVLILAAFPGQDAADPRLADPRLRYGLLVPPRAAAEASVDEDTALVTKYLLTIFTGRLYELFSMQPDQIEGYLDALLPPEALGPAAAVAKASFKGLYDRAAAAGVHARPPAERKQVAQRVADALLAQVRFDDLKVDPQFYDLSEIDGYADWETTWAPTRARIDASKSVLVYLRDIFAFVRERTADKMENNAAAPGTFPQVSYIDAANAVWKGQDADAIFPAKPHYAIERPSDMGDFILREYMATNGTHGSLPGLVTVLESLEAKAMPDGLATQGLLKAIEASMVMRLQLTMLSAPQGKNPLHEAIAPTSP